MINYFSAGQWHTLGSHLYNAHPPQMENIEAQPLQSSQLLCRKQPHKFLYKLVNQHTTSLGEPDMDGDLGVSLDKLPMKRLDSIEENGIERFPLDVGYDEKRLSLIRRIDFAMTMDKDDKKRQKKSLKENSTPWPWQSMVENLRLAHQELSVVIDLINTVESNNAVTVASMTRPKPFPNEVLADLSVSAATKLQCFRHLSKYFKQSATALEQQVARAARFYGALIRLQQNWKVKRQRMAVFPPGSEAFTIDLFDKTINDPTAMFRQSSLSPIHVDHDAAGMLTINLPPNSCHSLQFGFLSARAEDNSMEPGEVKSYCMGENKSAFSSDDECIKEIHSLLRDVHQTIFDGMVFNLVNREAYPSCGVNVTGMRENYLQLSIGQGTSVFISLVSSSQNDQTSEAANTQNLDNAILPLDTLDGIKLPEKSQSLEKKMGLPSRIGCEIYLRQIFHEHVFVRANERPISSAARPSDKASKDGTGLLGHFCLSLSHRIFSNKVLAVLENVAWKVPYVQFISHPTWHSRISSWTLVTEVPQSILHACCQSYTSDRCHSIKSRFRTKVVVSDDSISVEGEGPPNVVGVFKRSSMEVCSINRYDCDLADLSVIVLQQVASQVLLWLQSEALTLGIKANRDFLSLSIELDRGEVLIIAAHVDPEDAQGCISWWLVMDDCFAEEQKIHVDILDAPSEYKKFLGYLSLEVLYSTLLDLVSLCNGGSI